MKRAVLCVLLVSLVVASDPVRPSAGAVELSGLAGVFDAARGVVRDTNGDGLADAVVARVIVPAQATADEIQGAANLAARLGFESTALSLPIVVRDRDVATPASIELPILVRHSGIGQRQFDRT